MNSSYRSRLPSGSLLFCILPVSRGLISRLRLFNEEGKPITRRLQIDEITVIDNNPEELETLMERSSLEVSFAGAKGQTTMNVKVKFESAPTPESMSRVVRGMVVAIFVG
jgi:hypothetical protein